MQSDVDARHRLLFVHAVHGDLRYLSHLDMGRLFRRAMARAAFPIRYTEGFNPRPRIVMPLPRPVGVASSAEVLVVELTEPVDPVDALARLQHHTPRDLEMMSARTVPWDDPLMPTAARYRLEPDPADLADLQERVRNLLESDVVEVQRYNPKSSTVRTIDIRPYIEELRVVFEAVEFVLRLTPRGTAKPAEVAGALGYNADSINHRIRRLEIRWLDRKKQKQN